MDENGKCLSCCVIIWRYLRQNFLLLLIIVGSILGFIIGVCINGPVNAIENPEDRKTTVMLIGFPGELLMNMLKMIVLPLIIASLISALASLDPKATGRIGRRVLIFYLTTTVFAAILGLIFVLSIRPGRIDKSSKTTEDRTISYRTLDSFLDLLRSIFPSNIVAAFFSKHVTRYSSTNGKYVTFNTTSNVTTGPHTTVKAFNNGTHNISMVTREIYPPSNTIPEGTKIASGSNVLGIAVFCIVFGAVLSRLRERGEPLKVFFVSLNEVIMKIVYLIVWFAPIGICCLVCAKVALMNDILGTLQMIGLFMLSVISAIFLHGFVVLPLIYLALTRKNPYKFMSGMGDALVTAFGISSSAATLPTTIRCAVENNKIDERIAKFVLPLGATVNMDGGAIFEANVGVFVAQLNGVPITPAFIFMNIVMATAISVGSAGIPSAGFIFPVILLQALGLPVEDLALILPVEWLLDRFRTMVNVWGDSVGAGIVNHMSRDDLLAFDAVKVEEGRADNQNLAMRSIFPSNIVAAFFSKDVTRYSSTNGKYVTFNTTSNVTTGPHTTVKAFNNGTHNISMVTREIYPPSNTIPEGTKIASGSNVLGIAVFCIVFGAVLSRLREQGEPLKVFFVSLNVAIMKIVYLIMWFAPIGICCLVCSKVTQMNDILGTLQMIGLFMLSLISAIFLHGFVVLPLIYLALTRKNPYKFMSGMGDALVTAFGISSSAATLPTTIRCAVEKNKIDERIAKFVLPLGATVNMDGGAIFEANLAIFVAQLNGVPTTPSFIMMTLVMATAISVGAAGIPAAGLIFPIIVLQALGLPVEDLALVFPVVWILDRCVTVVNVWGDSVGAGIVNHISRDDLLAFDAVKVEEGKPENQNLVMRPDDENQGDTLL